MQERQHRLWVGAGQPLGLGHGPALRVKVPPPVYRRRKACAIRSRCQLGVEPTFCDDGPEDEEPVSKLGER